MEPVFIYFNELIFISEKKLPECLFKKKKPKEFFFRKANTILLPASHVS